jgi:hypothetical protein
VYKAYPLEEGSAEMLEEAGEATVRTYEMPSVVFLLLGVTLPSTALRAKDIVFSTHIRHQQS